jgi:glycosyltransferase involved in cell wall biosynthesis
MTELSVVLISKNQAWSIVRLMESVVRETASVPSKEIILIDSASTDETVELAGAYPIRILRLKRGQPLSPAIGRCIGYKQAQGEYVLFLDGDTELVEGWVTHALRVMRETPSVGAVTGHVINLPTAAVKEPVPLLRKTQMRAPRDVLWGSYGGGGAAMYRRTVLEEVGTFNPYLNSDEEPELGLRIRHAGYRILELDYPIVRHYNDAPAAMSTVLSRRRRNFLLGIGQGARYHLGDALLWRWLRERWWGPAAGFWMAAGFGTLLRSLLVRDFTWFSLWLLVLCLLIACLAFRKRSLRGAFVSVFNWVLLAEGVMRGFLMKPLPPENFRANFEVIEDFRDPEVVLGAPKSEIPTQESPSNRGKANDSAKRRAGRLAIPVPHANSREHG